MYRLSRSRSPLATWIIVLIHAVSTAIRSLTIGNTKSVRPPAFLYCQTRESKLASWDHRSRGKKCVWRPKSNGICYQRVRIIIKDPTFLNSRSRQAVFAMSEFLAANPPTNQGLPLHHLPSYVGADLVPRFDKDTAGLRSTIYIELAKVSRTWIRLQNCR